MSNVIGKSEKREKYADTVYISTREGRERKGILKKKGIERERERREG